ncbi:sigma 54-interacting transcriptional regulator [Microaerobacter geothermalis]|uniref:sigma 54-interacting transcriptional regulator n=1 Tax=Microaerobacter geothermalis TaxID=674972 RepID=UPI001F394F7E|nr:sigma 54-interacting transcriptional regulator [Microaerobacter geothermalis]MCF6094944.1 sigma 54-interacting transcriptional regulator [Microaerobacter geothermalis]
MDIFSIIIEELSYGMLVLDEQAKKIRIWNRRMAEWFGLKINDMVNQSLNSLPAEILEVYRQFTAKKKDRQEVEFYKQDQFFRGEWKRCQLKNQKNSVILIIRQDFSYQELKDVYQASFDEIIITDGEGKILWINAKSEELYGIPPSQLIGRKTTELSDEGYFTPSITPQIISSRERVSGIQETASGKKVYVTGNPILDENGNIRRIIFNSRDVDEIEMLQSRLEKTEYLLTEYRSQLTRMKQSQSEENDVIAISEKMKDLYQLVEKVALVDSTILVVGESGVGKGVFASLIHKKSNRKNQPFIHINCGAIPSTLIESELFGYEAGAFTGARKEGKRGVIEMAEGGTLFLDEIGEIPLNIQVKLLQVLQEGRFRRVGGNQFIQVNARIIAATNQDLRKMIAEGRFREDLYYRLNVIPITIPPLRHRKEEIPELIRYFLNKVNQKYQTYKYFNREAMEILCQYDWPGNVRELENMVERLVVVSESVEISSLHLPEYMYQKHLKHSSPSILVKNICPLKEAVEEVEKQLILKAYEKYQNTYRCAEALGVNQSTVVRKINKYAIKKGEIQWQFQRKN